MSGKSYRLRTTGCGKEGALRGVTLIEMLVVIAVASIMLGLAVLLIHMLLSTEREQARAAGATLSLSRLSRQFRDDVHAALRGSVSSETPALLTLELPANVFVAYTAREHLLARTETQGDREVHREMFRLPAATVVKFSLDEDPALVRLAIKLPGRPASHASRADGPSRDIQFEALVGRDRRSVAGGRP